MTDSPSFYLFAIKRIDRVFSGGFELGQTLGGHTMKGSLSGAEIGDIDSPKDDHNDPLSYSSSVKLKYTWVTPVLKIGKSDEDTDSSTRPYGMLGCGLYNAQNKAGSAALSGRTSAGADAAGRTFHIGSSGKGNFFGFNFGGGITGHFTKFELSADLRYHYIFLGSSSTQFMMPGARFSYIF